MFVAFATVMQAVARPVEFPILEHRLSDLEHSWATLETIVTVVAVTIAALAVIITLIGIVGYKLIGYWVAKQLDDATAELNGRIYAVQGLLFGRLCRDEHDRVYADREPFLNMAIEFTKEARQKLEAIPGTRSKYWWFVTNNLAFYYALKASVRGEDLNAHEALSIADELKGGRTPIPVVELYDTYARVAVAFCHCDTDAQRRLLDAHRWLNTLIESRATSPFERIKLERTRGLIEEKWQEIFNQPFPGPSPSPVGVGRPLPPP
jgi:hypothetical protein